VAQEVESILLIITTRPLTGRRPKEYDELVGLRGERRVHLSPLSNEEALQLAQNRLGVRSLPFAVGAFLIRHAGGHPFLLTELLNALLAHELITVSSGSCRLGTSIDDLSDFDKEFSRLNIPATVQGLIISRVDRLTPDEQVTLKVASVVGYTFGSEIVQSVCVSLEATGVSGVDLERLVAQGVILKNTGTTALYEFSHALIQETIYASVSKAQRKHLHELIASWYEERLAGVLPSYLPRLAHHWCKAEVKSKAIEYAVKAGTQALDGFSNKEAAGFFRDALFFADQKEDEPTVDISEAARWRLRLGRALVNTSEHNEAEANIETALRNLGYSVPKDKLTTLMFLGTECLQQVVHRVSDYLPLRSVAQGSALTLERAQAYESLMEIYYLQGLHLKTLFACLKSLNLAERLGPCDELARGYASFGAILGLVPWGEAAESYFSNALQIATRIKNPASLKWASLCEGVYRSGRGQWERARELFERMKDLGRHLGDERSIANAFQCLAMIEYFCGQFATTLHLTTEFYALAAKTSDQRFKAEALRWRAYALLAQGEFDLLPPCLAELEHRRLNANNRHMVNLGDVYALRAGLNLRLGQYEEALRNAKEASARLADAPNTAYEIVVERSLIAEVFLALWEYIGSYKSVGSKDADNALKECRDSAALECSKLQKLGRSFEMVRPFTYLRLGQQAYLQGDTSKALSLWSKSVNLANSLRMPYVEGLAEFERGRSSGGDLATREKSLDRARQLFQLSNANHDLARVQETTMYTSAA